MKRISKITIALMFAVISIVSYRVGRYDTVYNIIFTGLLVSMLLILLSLEKVTKIELYIYIILLLLSLLIVVTSQDDDMFDLIFFFNISMYIYYTCFNIAFYLIWRKKFNKLIVVAILFISSFTYLLYMFSSI